AKEELQIVSKSRLLSLCQAKVLPVIRGMTTLFTMYPWENGLPVVGIICFFLCYSVAIFVLAVDICPFMEIYRSGIKIFSFEQWLIPILFTVQVAQKCKRIIRITIIQCRISLSTNEDHRKRAITEKNKTQ